MANNINLADAFIQRRCSGISSIKSFLSLYHFIITENYCCPLRNIKPGQDDYFWQCLSQEGTFADLMGPGPLYTAFCMAMSHYFHCKKKKKKFFFFFFFFFFLKKNSQFIVFLIFFFFFLYFVYLYIIEYLFLVLF